MPGHPDAIERFINSVVNTAIWVVAVSAVVVILLVTLACYLSIRNQRRRNRFGSDDRIVAPLHWLYTPGEAPRLHRRLLAAVSAGRRAAEVIDGRRITASGVGEIALELERQAGAVDDGLILASRMTGYRRQTLLAELRPQVNEVESLSERLVKMALEWEQRGRRPVDTRRLHERLDALDQAQREIEELEVGFRVD